MARFEDNVICDHNVIIGETLDVRGSLLIPDGALTNAMILAGADIDATKLEHRHAISHGQDAGADVIAETKVIHLVKAPGVVQSIQVRPLTAPTGGDKKYTVDLKKAANGSAVFVTMLSAVITVDSANVSQTVEAGAFAGTPSVAAGDALQIVITPSGTTGSQGQGFIVTVNVDESGL